jgi:hypothetical protein
VRAGIPCAEIAPAESSNAVVNSPRGCGSSRTPWVSTESVGVHGVHFHRVHPTQSCIHGVMESPRPQNRPYVK